MFKRKLEVKLVKDDGSSTPIENHLTKEEYSQLAKEILTNIVVGTICVVVAASVVDTLGTITINALDRRPIV